MAEDGLGPIGLPGSSATTSDPRCPACDYSLRGLTESRCPECGKGFAWADVLGWSPCTLNAVLFEFQWRRRPLRSYFGTVRRTLMPWRFWPRLAASDPPRVVPLVATLVVTWLFYLLVVFLCDFAGHHVFEWGAQRKWAASGWRYAPFYWQGWFHRYEGALFGVVLSLIWLSANLCGGASRAISRRGQGHLLRLIVYSEVTLLLAAAATHALTSLAIALEPWHGGPILGQNPASWAHWYGGRLALLAFVVAFCLGCSQYLRLRPGWIWGLVVLTLATALWVMVLYGVTTRYYSTFDNPWMGVAERWFRGTRDLLGWLFDLRW